MSVAKSFTQEFLQCNNPQTLKIQLYNYVWIKNLICNYLQIKNVKNKEKKLH